MVNYNYREKSDKYKSTSTKAYCHNCILYDDCKRTTNPDGVCDEYIYDM